MFIFFSDYFSPLFVGPVMRGMTDKAKISREKLAYICDSTSAPKAVLVPIGAWSVYIAALLVGFGPINNIETAMTVYVKSIPFNLYSIFAIIFVALIALGIIPDFGPMKKAEKRAMEEGKVLADGAVPLMGRELSDIKRAENLKPRLVINFLIPVLLIMSIAVGTYIFLGSTKLIEAFMAADFYLLIVLLIQRVKLKDSCFALRVLCLNLCTYSIFSSVSILIIRGQCIFCKCNIKCK